MVDADFTFILEDEISTKFLLKSFLNLALVISVGKLMNFILYSVVGFRIKIVSELKLFQNLKSNNQLPDFP